MLRVHTVGELYNGCCGHSVVSVGQFRGQVTILLTTVSTRNETSVPRLSSFIYVLVSLSLFFAVISFSPAFSANMYAVYISDLFNQSINQSTLLCKERYLSYSS